MQFNDFYEKNLRHDADLEGFHLPSVSTDSNLVQWTADVLSSDGSTNPRIASLISYVLDCFWETGRHSDPHATLGEIFRTADLLLSHPATSTLPTSSIATLPDAVRSSASLLKFLFSGLLDRLRHEFVGCYLMGSLSYGRFYSVTGNRKDPSDLNLFLIYDKVAPELSAFRDPSLEDKLDEPLRFLYFRSGASASEAAVFNYKLLIKPLGHVLSVNIISLKAFHSIIQFDPDVRASLYWNVRLNGKKLLERDLAGRTVQIPYYESETPFGAKLTVPAFTTDRTESEQGLGVFCPLAGMILPRFDTLFSSATVAAEIDAMISSTARLMSCFRLAGRPARLTNAHPRQSRLSPLVAQKLNDRFPFAYSPQRTIGTEPL